MIYCGRGNFLGTTKSSAQQQQRRLPARVAALEREENVLFSVVEAAAAPMLTQTPAVAADLRSNYFWYQSRSVRWLDKKLKDAKKKN